MTTRTAGQIVSGQTSLFQIGAFYFKRVIVDDPRVRSHRQHPIMAGRGQPCSIPAAGNYVQAPS